MSPCDVGRTWIVTMSGLVVEIVSGDVILGVLTLSDQAFQEILEAIDAKCAPKLQALRGRLNGVVHIDALISTSNNPDPAITEDARPKLVAEGNLLITDGITQLNTMLIGSTLQLQLWGTILWRPWSVLLAGEGILLDWIPTGLNDLLDGRDEIGLTDCSAQPFDGFNGFLCHDGTLVSAPSFGKAMMMRGAPPS